MDVPRFPLVRRHRTRNGAGKTTTMRLILGLDSPTAGTVTTDGKPHPQLPSPMREVGALLDARAVHGGRSARRSGQAIRVRTPQPDALARAVAAAGGTAGGGGDPGELEVHGLTEERIGGIAFAHGVRLNHLAPSRATLEQAFMELTADDVEYHAWLPAGALAVLTLREREVLSLVAQGRSNTAIASAFTISPRVAGKHVASIFAKLGLAPSGNDNRRVLATIKYLES